MWALQITLGTCLRYDLKCSGNRLILLHNVIVTRNSAMADKPLDVLCYAAKNCSLVNDCYLLAKFSDFY